MRKCNHCGVEIIDITDRCPLCHSILEENEQKQGEEFRTYPDVYHKNKKINFIMRLLLLIAIVVTGLCVFINYNQKTNMWWSVIVGASLLYVLWMLYLLSKDGSGYRVRIFGAVLGAAALVILIDSILGFHGWSVNFVLPAAMILVDIALIILMLVNRRNWQSYMILQIAMILLGFVPLFLIYKSVVTVPLISEVAFGVAIVVFLASLILGGKTAMDEMKRRFHI